MTKNHSANKSKIPYIFIGFFLVVITVNIGYIYIAKKTWRGVVTENSYQKGLGYNDALKQEKKQQELGWSVDTKINKTGETKATILVGIIDKESRPIRDANVKLFIRHPVQEGFDFTASPVPGGNAYRFEIDFPMKGQWDTIIEIQKGVDKLYLAKRYEIK